MWLFDDEVVLAWTNFWSKRRVADNLRQFDALVTIMVLSIEFEPEQKPNFHWLENQKTWHFIPTQKYIIGKVSNNPYSSYNDNWIWLPPPPPPLSGYQYVCSNYSQEGGWRKPRMKYIYNFIKICPANPIRFFFNIFVIQMMFLT